MPNFGQTMPNTAHSVKMILRHFWFVIDLSRISTSMCVFVQWRLKRNWSLLLVRTLLPFSRLSWDASRSCISSTPLCTTRERPTAIWWRWKILIPILYIRLLLKRFPFLKSKSKSYVFCDFLLFLFITITQFFLLKTSYHCNSTEVNSILLSIGFTRMIQAISKHVLIRK